MTPAARISAAIEVLEDIEARRRPVTDALKDWGLSHRFAGSKDRAAIASLVYDALRRKASAAWVMGDGTPRAVVMGMLRLQRGLDGPAIANLFSGDRFAPQPLTDAERQRLETGSLKDAPAPAAGDFPDWIEPSLRRVFGDDLVPELQALTARAPLDLRVNTLKVSGREEAHDALPHLGAVETPLSPLGLRIAPSEDGRGPSIQSEPEFIKGWIEIQDEGSQLAALLSGAKPGEQVVDLCAGGGGKTLALAAMMDNHGQLYATDSDARRLAPIHERLTRAGVRNVQVRTPRAKADAVTDLDGRIDLVLVDAPCTGCGTWRRNPDSKWRLRPGSLEARLKDQALVLDRAARLLKPAGRIAYITCSILPEENDDAVAGLLEREPSLSAAPVDQILREAGLPQLKDKVRVTAHGLQLTPARTGTDGFYLSILRRGT
ncbi:RsmB/NOP family class I SAM-dependent RNA methyltransferase [Microvirga pudoricolor]|uniref:RsmB/NOP family class I SAM-dependent RNA methyltransferase n=1 Tax=Microvirga pudoricolor TaxID=2778729 RepID=UPI00194F801A|nr:RsmB/NOP family class I SAM-dependent RNA methyltransferase [Microvirga pudoricolor]MBM6594158.1 RsmB/NOP family class I SAM-dependent RNA methyltransferase [Microvirga pudoricolor]